VERLYQKEQDGLIKKQKEDEIKMVTELSRLKIKLAKIKREQREGMKKTGLTQKDLDRISKEEIKGRIKRKQNKRQSGNNELKELIRKELMF